MWFLCLLLDMISQEIAEKDVSFIFIHLLPRDLVYALFL